jgi:hypothetical protein
MRSETMKLLTSKEEALDRLIVEPQGRRRIFKNFDDQKGKS